MHTDSAGSYDLRRKGINTEKARGRGGKGLQEGVKGKWIEWDFVRLEGSRQADGARKQGAGVREQSILYSHSLNPLSNRSMKWHSPVQKRKVRRKDGERRYSCAYISPDLWW